ncbi:MAG: type II toxin-antitoxin system HicA family toxin [Deltaproteobacteria bacterium]
MPKRPFKLRELAAKLKPYGIMSLTKRGKGSERILLKPKEPGSKKGPQYPIKDHGEGAEISIPVIKAALRRFGISEDEFWGEGEGGENDKITK